MERIRDRTTLTKSLEQSSWWLSGDRFKFGAAAEAVCQGALPTNSAKYVGMVEGNGVQFLATYASIMIPKAGVVTKPTHDQLTALSNGLTSAVAFITPANNVDGTVAMDVVEILSKVTTVQGTISEILAAVTASEEAVALNAWNADVNSLYEATATFQGDLEMLVHNQLVGCTDAISRYYSDPCEE